MSRSGGITAAFLSVAGGVLAVAAFQGHSAGERVAPPEPASTAIACNAAEPGERLLISGRVLNDSRQPIVGAMVVAYNTDAAGLYNPRDAGTPAPRIQAGVTTDRDGRFQVLTVFPGAYPDSDDPAHVHFDVLAAGYRKTYSTIWFKGDPRITPAVEERMRESMRRNPDDTTTAVDVVQDGRGVKIVDHQIILGRN